MPSQDLKDLRIYQLAMKLGEEVYAMVDVWPWFPKQTMGLQIVKAVDSIAANISEGYGRYSYKENARFCYFARGSLRETATWLEKVFNRNLMTAESFAAVMNEVHALRRQLDRYIRSIGKPSFQASVKEDQYVYAEGDLPSLEAFLNELEAEADHAAELPTPS